MRLLGICPRIRKEGVCIIAITALRIRILFLGAFFKQVTIDPRHRTLTVASRYFWLFKRKRKYRFKELQAITYGYEDWNDTSWVSFSHDSFDWFTVGIRLRCNREFKLFNFIGDGTFTNNGPLPDWMYWEEYVTDFSGNQEKASRCFVDLLCQMTGKKVVPPNPYLES